MRSEAPTAQAEVRKQELLFLDGLDGAVLSASAAADTNVGIDDVLLVALRDSLNGAVVSTATALDACISNFVHDFPSRYVMMVCSLARRNYILACIFKNAIPFFVKCIFFVDGGEIF